MKTITQSIAIIFVLFAASSFASSKPVAHVKVISDKRYVFHFKVEKDMIGGTVELIDANNNVIMTSVLNHFKNIIDFFELPVGAYTIKIAKGTEVFKYEYKNVE